MIKLTPGMFSDSISVIVPVKNGEDNIEKCIMAILDQELQPFEIIVIDGHSTDKTVEIVRRFPVRLIYEEYGTVGGARQIGLVNARGNYIAFTDADCIPERRWLRNLANSFEEGIVGVGGGIRNIGDGLWEQSIALALDSFLGGANSVQDRVYNEKRIVKSISGCNSIYKRDILIKVGGFNKDLSINEDTEINYRLRKLGKLLYVPNAIVLHDQKRTIKEFAKRMYLFGYGRGNVRIFDLQVIPPIMAFAVILLLFISVNGFLFMVVLYMIILLFFDLILFSRIRGTIFLITIPIVFLLEHIAYSFGFWKGFIKSVV